ncbi:THAP domain-containing protein 1-like [Engraulis encrasicolus]|uniref:THAP domain-containing protein 1-like n=1 Tax=Engraulis encrasicolus TaxID=184585 RepID=UPI002FD33EFB
MGPMSRKEGTIKRNVRGTQCCAYGCRKRKKQKGSLEGRSDSEGSEDEDSVMKRSQPRTFHAFPKDPEKKSVWLIYLHRPNYEPSVHARVCSDHFTESHMDRTGQIIRLRENANPTRIKNLPKKIRMKVRRQAWKLQPTTTPNHQLPVKQPEQMEDNGPKSDCNDVTLPMATHCTTNDRPGHQVPQPFGIHILDHLYYRHEHEVENCIRDPKLFVCKLQKSTERVKHLTKKLKISQQKSRRLQRKVRSLKDLVKSLRQKLKRSEQNSQPNTQQNTVCERIQPVKMGQKAKKKICDMLCEGEISRHPDPSKV